MEWSPNARATERTPLTRQTPKTCMTLPPAACTRESMARTAMARGSHGENGQGQGKKGRESLLKDKGEEGGGGIQKGEPGSPQCAASRQGGPGVRIVECEEQRYAESRSRQQTQTAALTGLCGSMSWTYCRRRDRTAAESPSQEMWTLLPRTKAVMLVQPLLDG